MAWEDIHLVTSRFVISSASPKICFLNRYWYFHGVKPYTSEKRTPEMTYAIDLLSVFVVTTNGSVFQLI